MCRHLEASRNKRIEAVSKSAATICEAVAALPSSDLHAILQTIVLQAQSLTGAELGAFGIGTDPTCPFDPWVYSGVAEEDARSIGRTPRPLGTLGLVACEGMTLRPHNFQDHSHIGILLSGHPLIRCFSAYLFVSAVKRWATLSSREHKCVGGTFTLRAPASYNAFLP